MQTQGDEENQSIYRRAWDGYVRHGGYAGHEWPGDEWGTPESWELIFQRLFVPAGVAEWERAVEIGPGSGKYTLKVLDRSQAKVRGYDISTEFLNVCERRCKSFIEDGRLSLGLLSSVQPDTMLRDIESAGWRRKVDALYSIDAMVHVDLQYLFAYVLTAALVLKPGGALILTLADPTTPLGFTKLLEDISAMFPLQSGPSAKFEWVSQDLVRSVLTRLGFSVDSLFNDRRDLLLVARLTQPEIADQLRHYLTQSAVPS